MSWLWLLAGAAVWSVLIVATLVVWRRYVVPHLWH